MASLKPAQHGGGDRVPTTLWPEEYDCDWPTLRQQQLHNAWAVVEQLAASNPFYAPRLARVSTVDRSAQVFAALPLTTKDEVVADCVAHPPYGRRTVAHTEAIRQVVETSGTSGKGREVYALDEVDEQAVYRSAGLGFWWAGVRPGSRVFLTLPVGTSAAGLWYLGGLKLIGANVMSAGAYVIDRKVQILSHYGADVVVGTPSYLQRLAGACEDAGVEPSSLGVRSLVVAGESYTVSRARHLERQWGARLYEQYGCTERAMAWTCPQGAIVGDEFGVLHFVPELAYCEIVDPERGTLRSRSGDRGELVLTPLSAAASPLLRFATRDDVEFVDVGDCPCGLALPGIRAGGVRRYDGMLKVRGLNVWPTQLDAAVFAVPGVADYRGVVRLGERGEEVVRIVVEPDLAIRDEAAISEGVVSSVGRDIGLRVEVEMVWPGAVTSSVPEGFVKVSRWQDLRNEGATPQSPSRTNDQGELGVRRNTR